MEAYSVINMRVLLDTHILLWALFFPEKLTEEAKRTIRDKDNEIVVSMASLWEIGIKHLRRPDTMPYCSRQIEECLDAAGYRLLPIPTEHVHGLWRFVEQGIHHDPFDHLLLSTSREEQMTLITHDENIFKYQGALITFC